VRSNAEARSNAGARGRTRPSHPAICARCPSNPSLPGCAVTFSAAVERTCAVERITFERRLRSNALGQSLAYIKDPRPFGRIYCFGGVFGEHFAPPLLVPLLLFVSFYSTFNFNALFHFNYALLFNG
jgi:hypothetical protein